MNLYVQWVSANPLTSSAIQFAILGTLGEIISQMIRRKRVFFPFGPFEFLGKLIAWAVLGVVTKYGFVGIKGFVRALIAHHLLPNGFSAGIGWAFSVSLFVNILFGPQMMLFHRVEDNIIMRRWDFTGLKSAWFTLIWFWIPAHTVTFSLPREYQIGFAALWSIVLGVIMGITTPKR